MHKQRPSTTVNELSRNTAKVSLHVMTNDMTKPRHEANSACTWKQVLWASTLGCDTIGTLGLGQGEPMPASAVSMRGESMGKREVAHPRWGEGWGDQAPSRVIQLFIYFLVALKYLPMSVIPALRSKPLFAPCNKRHLAWEPTHGSLIEIMIRVKQTGPKTMVKMILSLADFS